MRGTDSSAGTPVSGSIHSEMPASASASATESSAWTVGSSRPSASAVASASEPNGPFSTVLVPARQYTPFGRSMNWTRSSSGGAAALFLLRLVVFPCFIASTIHQIRLRPSQALLVLDSHDQEYAEQDRSDARD